MLSKLFELTGLGLIAYGLAQAISTPAGLIFGGAAMVFIGSVTDDASVGLALRRGTGWIRYAWWRQVALENGVSLPRLRADYGQVACDCGGDEDCPICDGTGLVPDPTIHVNPESPHPPIKVNPQAEEFWSRQARARQERSKLHDRTPALSRPDYNGDDLERIG